MKTCPICQKEFENDFALNGHIRLSKDPHHKQHYNEQNPTDQTVLYRIEQKKGYDRGFDAGTVDGIFGRRTAKAVREFQKSQGFLKVTGVVNGDTFGALFLQ